MLHYYARDFFAPIIVTYYVKGTDLTIYIVSDKLHPVRNTTLEVNLHAWNSMKPIRSYTHYNITIVSIDTRIYIYIAVLLLFIYSSRKQMQQLNFVIKRSKAGGF